MYLSELLSALLQLLLSSILPSSIQTMNGVELTSSATLVRTLKSNTVSSTDKIRLATLAWFDAKLYLPAKREVLMEWLTADMTATKQGGGSKAKGKGKVQEESVPRTPSILSQPHWNLLVNLLPVPSSLSSSATSSSVFSLPAAATSLLSSFFRQLPSHPESLINQPQLLDEVAQASCIIVELLSTTAEGLMDLLGEALDCWERFQNLDSNEELISGWETVMAALADSLNLTLPNNLARTKLSQTHLQSSIFPAYIHYLSHKPSTSPLYIKLLNLQGSIIFPVENLKIYLPPPPSNKQLKPRKQVRGLIGTQNIQAPPVIASTPKDIEPSTATQSIGQSDATPKLYKALSKLVEAPETTSWVLLYLPHLLRIFTSILAIHRHTLFPLPLNAKVPVEVHSSEQISKCTLRFVRALKEVIGDKGKRGERWACERDLWEVLEDRGKVGRGYQEGENEEGWLGLGKTVLEWGLGELEGSSHEEDVNLTDSILMTLTILLRLDRTLCDPFISRLLISISKMPSSAPSGQSLLNTLLAYHRSTRTLPTFIDLLTEAIITAPTPSTDYQTLAAGPLFDAQWLDCLTGTIKSFLGVQGQMTELLRSLRLILKDCLASLERALSSSTNEGDRERSRKKRRVGENGGLDQYRLGPKEIDDSAAVLSLFSRFASSVIIASGSLLISSLPEGLLNSLKEDLRAIHSEVVVPLFELGLDDKSKGNLWAREMGLVSGLRIFEALRDILDDIELSKDEDLKLGDVLDADGLGGEATVEAIRTYIRSSSLHPSAEIRKSRCSKTLSDVLGFISRSVASATWSGRLADLDLEGHKIDSSVAVALWALLTGEEGRWIGVIDYLNIRTQLDAVCSIIINSFSLISNGDEALNEANRPFTLHSLTIAMMLQPQLPELANIRHSLLKSIDSLTSTIAASPSATDTRCFELLLALPSEYTPRSQKSELIARALSLEKALKLTRAGPGEEWETRLRARALLRKVAFGFIKALGTNANFTIDNKIMNYLILQSPIDELHASSPFNATLEQSTLSILNLTFRSIIRGTSSDGLASLTETFTSNDAQTSLEEIMEMDENEEDAEDFILDFSIRSRLQLLQAIMEEVKNSKKFSEETYLEQLVNPLQKALSYAFEKIHQSFIDGRLVRGFADLLEALAITRTFESWMGTLSTGVRILPQELVKACLRFLKASTIQNLSEIEILASSMLRLNVVEVQTVRDPTLKSEACTVFMAGWLALSSAFTARDQRMSILSAPLLSFSKALDSEERTSLLQSLIQTLLSEEAEPAITEAKLLATNIILKEGSEISNRAIVSKLVIAAGAYVNDKNSCGVVAQALSIAHTVCSDKASHLQMPDVDQLLATLSRAVAPRPLGTASSSTTRHDLFRMVVSSLTDLVRHRRDLVSSAAVHLSALLSQLIGCFQTVRSNLGGRQVRIVESTLPGWINSVDQPLNADDARCLARLLTSLTAKTIPRLNTRLASSASTKAESLAGPLSKHAPYLLLAYTRLLTDLNTTVPPLIRRELEPGVFAICGMVGEKDRDSVMVGGGLDGGGKGILKMVWNAWESSRYVGKG
ncbi:Nucleolar 27S pre-rRNA processing, Urb2/Npa2, C-terminal [Phaffia rhodozyma]|uniref:Nucleolar 27S pre-rRNA processing, Urb2/Npa2, C-terminal n=1 Tax=Phaffia rhodozyma TaxID=264483 RepID=A0A0F7SGD8_PHARH|nr:Nucleolar 27S pre-rRNA processing, Urb2/Npa2, C-terminal [Phaffia rhodozyma]